MAYDHSVRSPWNDDDWTKVELQPSLLVEALRVFAWIAMLLFIGGIILTFTASGNEYGTLVALSGLGWMACAVSIIRIRRRLSRKVTILE